MDEGREDLTKGSQLKTVMVRGVGGLVSLVAPQPGLMTPSEGGGGLGFWPGGWQSKESSFDAGFLTSGEVQSIADYRAVSGYISWSVCQGDALLTGLPPTNNHIVSMKEKSGEKGGGGGRGSHEVSCQMSAWFL